MMYIFNAKDYLLYPTMKSYFNLSPSTLYQMISDSFDLLQQRLAAKNISYEKLKGALIPNQEKDKFETCLVFDSSQIKCGDYGYAVFDTLLPLLDRESTYSILCGDYIDILDDMEDSQMRLKAALNEGLCCCNATKYQYSGQYYLVYINRLTKSQRWNIIENLLKYPWFTGFVDVTHLSLFKSYLSNILVHSYIKCRNQMIASHPSDYGDEVNIDMLSYPLEKHGFSFASISEDSFGPFLSYKIESIIPDEEDVGFSFNVLFPKFDSIKKLKLVVGEEKWDKYLVSLDPKKKGKLLQTIGYGAEDRDKFTRDIYKKICSCYIYNLRKHEKDALLFNVCVDLLTVEGNRRKTTIALKYQHDTGEILLVTVT